MSHDGNAPTGQDVTPDRKALLLEQFNEAEAASNAVANPNPAPVAQTPAPDGAVARARDDAGKFVAKDKTAAVIAAPDPAAAPVQQEPWMAAPKSWKKELSEGWTKLDPAYQRYVHEREQQMKGSYDAIAPKAELAEKLNKAAEPYLNTIQGLGLDLPQAVSGLMKVDHDLRTLPYEQKVQRLAQIALSYGIDLSGQVATAKPAFDPGVQQIQNELLSVKGQFANFTKQQEAAQDRAAMEEIQRFKQTAEHFDEVSPLIAKLLQGGLAEGISDAYEKAISLTPALSEKIQAAKQAASDIEKRKAADEAAKRAKAAAVSVKSATPGAQTKTAAQSRREMLAEQFNDIDSRL